ncbi:MAG: universal stress protein, partial [Lapillicoccus sp.]
VVVGVDGSPATALAVDWAVARARMTGAPLRLVSAYLADNIIAPVPGARTGGPGRLRPTGGQVVALHHLDAAVRRIRTAAPTADVETAAVAGPARAVLLHEAQRAQVIVVGSRRLGAAHRLFSPSTGAASTARAACPVVVVREAATRSLPEARVVVGVDGPASRSALRFAFEEADRWGTGLTAVYAWRLNAADLGSLVRPGVTHETVPAAARALVADLVHPVAADHPEVDVRIDVVEGHAVDELVSLSANARLVVVGSRGLGSLWALLLGSVSREVIRQAHCPVAVVHPQSAVEPTPTRRPEVVYD